MFEDQTLADDAEEFDYILRQVIFIVRKRGREIMRRFQITSPQLNALFELFLHGNLTMGELCSRLYLASSTVTEIIDRLERNGFVTRTKDEEDGRLVRIQVLPAGYELMETVMKDRRDYWTGIFKRIRRDERRVLLKVLRHIHHVMIDHEVRTPY